MKLHFRKLGEGKPLFVLHGVFGSSDNWQTLGKVFAENHQVYLIDLRNHGKSPHSNEFNYEVMAQDLLELMNGEGLDKINILGHSMGGKVAMELATNHSSKIENLIVVDIAPKIYPPHHQQIFAGFHSVNLPAIKSRKEADQQMASEISNMGVRQFILKNLTRGDNGAFTWKLNLSVIEESIEEVGDNSVDSSFEGDTLFIAGGKSDYILEKDHELIYSLFPKAQLETIENAGHWVHAEQPKVLSQIVLEFLK